MTSTPLPFAEAQQDRPRCKLTLVQRRRSFELDAGLAELLAGQPMPDALKPNVN